MNPKPDHWIEEMARTARMITPYISGQISDGVISYGQGSYGYDIRVAEGMIYEP